MICKLFLRMLVLISLYTDPVSANLKSVVDDSFITAIVKSKLLNEKDLSAYSVANVKVETIQGIVILKGTVKSTVEVSKIVEIVISTNGVVDVEATNLIIEGNKYPIRDAIITSKIQCLFVKEKIFGDKSTFNVHIETIEGVVYLSGTVKDKSVIETAMQLAKSVKEAKDVKSSLKVI